MGVNLRKIKIIDNLNYSAGAESHGLTAKNMNFSLNVHHQNYRENQNSVSRYSGYGIVDIRTILL